MDIPLGNYHLINGRLYGNPRFLLNTTMRAENNEPQLDGLCPHGNFVASCDICSAESFKQIPEDILARATQILRMAHGRLDRKMAIGGAAKESGVSPEEALHQIRIFAKSKIAFPEKTFHYHQTGFDRLDDVLKMGALLSRPKLQERNPNVSLPPWSSSDDVMMTRDHYDSDGKLYIPGFSPHGVGNLSKGVTFIMGLRIIDQLDYDTTGHYPTISEAQLEKVCDAVLADTPDMISVIKEKLASQKLDNIPVVLKSEWEKSLYEDSEENET